ncbi:PREDICTED: uncharacterized protein LOC109482706 [Branchiostoma belcheri]|uniref:Uncharacterized protein LOC109482706 n=1 Tax=Branchiostoma belcheri TaxID=7741 RepID=A0A6P4ZVZ0_BRABE|nr:PREDICTED: uncharacterized protein LOC109482706 [Branchiostoma belcheri]
MVMAGITPDLLKFLLMTSLCALWLAAVGIHLKCVCSLSGGDYPGLMIEAYKTDNTTILYFNTVVYIGQFFVFALLVAQIYDSYKFANKKRIKEERLEERQCLVKAFDAIDFAKIGVISYQQWRRLYRELDPRATNVETMGRFLKFKELAGHDVDPGNKSCNTENEMLTLVEFLFLPDVLQFTVEKLQVTAFRRDASRENLVAMATELLAIGCHVTMATAREEEMLRTWSQIAAFFCMLVRLGVIWIPLSTWFHWARRMALPYVILTSLTYVIMYVTAVIGTELFARVSGFKPPRGFQDFDTAMLTLFQILMGSGWDGMMQTVAMETSYWACAYFLLYFTLMHLLVVNVAMAIMVDLVAIIQADMSLSSMDLSLPLSVLMPDLGSHVTGFHSNSPTDDSPRDPASPGATATSRDAVLHLSGRKSLGNWRRELLGDITVLNSEELRRLSELSKSAAKLRTQARTQLRRRISSTLHVMDLEEDVEEEEETV